MEQVIDTEEICLEVLQHNGGWMSLSTIQATGKIRSSAGCYTSLQRLVSERKACSMRASGHTEWKAVFERDV